MNPVPFITKDDTATLRHFAHMCTKATDEQLIYWRVNYMNVQPLFVEIIERVLAERSTQSE